MNYQDHIKKIFIIHTWGIGDFIMFLPALNILKRNFPKAKVDLLIGTPSVAQVVEGTNLVDEFFIFNTRKDSMVKKIKLALNLKKRNYDLSIVTDGINPFKSSFFSYLVGAKIRLGQYRKIPQIFFNKQIKFDVNKHRVERNIDLIRLLGCEAKTIVFNFPILEKEEQLANEYFVKNFSEDNFVVGFHPGCDKKNSYKRWEVRKWIQLCKMLQDRFKNISFAIFGGPDEKEVAEEIVAKIKEASITKAVPFTGFHLRVTATLIKRCSIFINTDSGLGHIAASLNVPTFTIFGPTNPIWTKPYSKKAVAIQKGLSCQPCNGKLDICKGRINCLRDLTPEEVFRVIVKNYEDVREK